MTRHIAALIALTTMCSLATAEPQPLITAAAHLVPRATDPSLVGYISASGSGSSSLDVRSCDYPQTISTSGAYVQCCPPSASGSCVFYTTCSSNTLFAAGSTSVACDVDTALMCNTGLVVATAGASTGASYLACWQKTLGAGEFTIVQEVAGGAGSTGAVATSTNTAPSGSTSTSGASSRSTSGSGGSSSSSTGSSRTGSSSSATAAASTTSSASSNAAAAISEAEAGFTGSMFGLFALIVQIVL